MSLIYDNNNVYIIQLFLIVWFYFAGIHSLEDLEMMSPPNVRPYLRQSYRQVVQYIEVRMIIIITRSNNSVAIYRCIN